MYIEVSYSCAIGQCTCAIGQSSIKTISSCHTCHVMKK